MPKPILLKPIPRNRPGPKPRAIDWLELRKLVIAGATVREVSEKLGLGHGSAQRAIRIIKDDHEKKLADIA